MSLVMKKVYSIQGDYTREEKRTLSDLINVFRVLVADDIPDKNLIDGKQSTFSDDKIVAFLNLGVWDINSGNPKSNYSVFQLYNGGHQMLICRSAMIQMLISEGILQLKNHIDYNDAGLSIAMFNKTSLYQSWLGQMTSLYFEEKRNFKESIITSQPGGGFHGILSQYGYGYYGRGR